MAKKFLLIIILTSLIFSSFVFPQKSVKAQGGLTQMVSQLFVKLGIFSAISGAGAAASMLGVPINNIAQNIQGPSRAAMDTADIVIKAIFTMFLEVAKKKLLNQLTDNIIGYTQGGGEPRFVSNWEDYSNQAYTRGANEAWEEIPANYICPEFRDDLQRTLGVRFSDNPRPSQSGWTESLKCTLGQNDYSFAKPQNNLYGAYTMIQNQMAYQGTVRAQAAQNEAIAGQGFISPKKCLETDNIGRCLKETVLTPGATISNLVNKTLGADIDYIVNAQELEQYLTAIVYAAINRLLEKGLSDMGMSTEEQWTIDTTAQESASIYGRNINEANLDQIINEYKKAGDELAATLTIKEQTLRVAQNIVSTLKACYMSSGNAEADVKRIQADITNINNLIDETLNLLDEAQNVKQNSPNDDQAVKEVAQKFNNFISQNAFTIYSGRQTAQQELSDKQKELQQTQQRCLIV